MKYNVYSVKDFLSGVFTNLELFPNDAMAERWFEGLCRESKISKDLSLFRLGVYDIQTGKIEESIEFLKGGVDYE